jgi:hypothetical protein
MSHSLIIIFIKGHPEYQSSLRWLLDFVEEYYGHGMSLAEHHASNGTDKFNTVGNSWNIRARF